MKQEYSAAFISDIIRMAWAERGVSEAEVIAIMRANLKAGSFKLWRKRVSGRPSKHEKRTKLLREAMG
jgi:uncharacterized protein (TIGR03643 family)